LKKWALTDWKLGKSKFLNFQINLFFEKNKRKGKWIEVVSSTHFFGQSQKMEKFSEKMGRLKLNSN